MVPLGEVVSSAGPRGGQAGASLPVYSVTKHEGFVPSLEYFKKQVFSRDVDGYRVVEPGQFAYATIHLDEGSIGIAPERCLISPMYSVFSIDPRMVEPGYLVRLLKSPWALAHYPSLGRGAIHRRQAISLSALGSLKIPLPALSEQRRIAAILDQADALRTKRRQVLAHLDALPQAIFHDMFGDPSCWPSRWNMGLIGDLAESVVYGTSARAGEAGAWPILRMGNITDDGLLDLTDLKYLDLPPTDVPKYTVRRGDLLFNRTNSREKVGKAAVVRTDRPLAVAGYLVRVRFADASRGEFVSAFLNSRHGRAVRQRLAKAAVNQANINASEMRRIAIAVPPTDVTEQFSKVITRAAAEREVAWRALAADDGLFACLQSRAFRGEL